MATGKCTNIMGCSKAKNRYVQDADPTNFVCKECGKPLVKADGPVTDPDSTPSMPMSGGFGGGGRKGPKKGFFDKYKMEVIVAAAVVVVCAAAAIVWNSFKSSDSTIVDLPIDSTTQTIDTVKLAPVDSVTPPKPEPQRGNAVFGGAAYISRDQSTITFTREYNLDLHSRDNEYLTFSKGDKIIHAKFESGHLTGGVAVVNGRETPLYGLYNKL